MYDVVIIGSGPAGYVAAIRAGQLGMKCAVVERNKVGGMCLNWGCIPSKAMLESAKLYVKIANDADRFGIDGIDKKQVAFNWNKALKRAGTIVKKLTTGVGYLLKKNGVELISGNARMVSAHRVEVGDTSLDTKAIILATGSHAPELVTKHQGLVVDAASLFDEREWSNANVVVGNNSVAVELVQLFNLIGKEVTLVVEGDSFLGQLDAYLSDYMLKQLKKDKVRVVFTDTLDLDKQWADQQLKVGEEVIPCGVVINARSRIANKIECVEPLAYDDGFIRVNENLETSITDVYAIGDANGVSAFAHAASAQGLFV
ncbi:MAG: FAD-dependent oxidoreductase, partial [Tannerellaceae bacterium]